MRNDSEERTTHACWFHFVNKSPSLYSHYGIYFYLSLLLLYQKSGLNTSFVGA